MRVLGFYFPNVDLSFSIETRHEPTRTLENNFGQMLLSLDGVGKGPVVLIPINYVSILIEHHKHGCFGDIWHSQSLVCNQLNSTESLKQEFTGDLPLRLGIRFSPNLCNSSQRNSKGSVTDCCGFDHSASIAIFLKMYKLDQVPSPFVSLLPELHAAHFYLRFLVIQTVDRNQCLPIRSQSISNNLRFRKFGAVCI